MHVDPAHLDTAAVADYAHKAHDQTIVGFLTAHTMVDDSAKKRHLTVNPRYPPLAMPVLLVDEQRGVVAGVPFGPAGKAARMWLTHVWEKSDRCDW